MLRRCFRRFPRKTNRYTDGSGRKLDPAYRHERLDLYLEPLNNPLHPNGGYPQRSNVWHPVLHEPAGPVAVAEEQPSGMQRATVPSTFKGTIVVVGGGVVGSTAALLLGLKGWHVTLVEKESDPSAVEPTAASGRSVLLTKRALDVLHAAGVRKDLVKAIGTRVQGILDHPSTTNYSWLSKGLHERHDFAVNMLAVDLSSLRGMLHRTIRSIPHTTKHIKIVYDHSLVALLPDEQKAILRPKIKWNENDPAKPPNLFSLGNVVMNGMRFEDDLEGLDYDVLVGADGANSEVRRLSSIDASASVHHDWSVRWFQIEKANHLDSQYVHRWIHRFNKRKTMPDNLGVIFAYPRGQMAGFSVMAYMPQEYLVGEFSIDDFISKWCPDLLGPNGKVVPDSISVASPHPTIHCARLHNDMLGKKPSAVLIGDAAHLCNPFLQQNFPLAMEDAALCADHLDFEERQNLSRRTQMFSDQRGVQGDALRAITTRSLYYEQKKHVNPLLRFRNTYTQFMHAVYPRNWNETYATAYNHLYPRSLEQMLNGRGYIAYTEADQAQYRTNQFWTFTRVYT